MQSGHTSGGRRFMDIWVVSLRREVGGFAQLKVMLKTIPMTSQTILINGLAHRIYQWGDTRKPKLFFFHGWMDSGASYAFVAEHLKDHFNCIALDFRGFGHSAHTSNPLGYFFHEFVHDVHGLLDQLSPETPARVVGHSMGGTVLSLYAGTYPERVSHFVNLEGLGPSNVQPDEVPQRMYEWIEASYSAPLDAFRVYPDMESVVERLVKANPRVPRLRLETVAQAMTHAVDGGFAFSSDPRHKWRHSYVTPVEYYQAFWQRISAKCLIILAEKTDLQKWLGHDDYGAELQRRFSFYPKGTRVQTVSDCGHMLHLEKPDVIAQLITSHLLE